MAAGQRRLALAIVGALCVGGCEIAPIAPPPPASPAPAPEPEKTPAPEPSRPPVKEPVPARAPDPATPPSPGTPKTNRDPPGQFADNRIAQLFVARITPIKRGDESTGGLDPNIVENGWDWFAKTELEELRAFYGPHLKSATVVAVRPFGSYGLPFEADVPAKMRDRKREDLMRGMAEAYARIADEVGTLILYVGSPDNRPADFSREDAAARARLDQTTQLFRQIKGSRQNVGVGLDASARWPKGSRTWTWAHQLQGEGFWPIVYEAAGPAGNPWNELNYWCIARNATLVDRALDTEFSKPEDVRGTMLRGFQAEDQPRLEDVVAVLRDRSRDHRVYAPLPVLRRMGITNVSELGQAAAGQAASGQATPGRPPAQK